jgi:hypothetical protein
MTRKDGRIFGKWLLFSNSEEGKGLYSSKTTASFFLPSKKDISEIQLDKFSPK